MPETEAKRAYSGTKTKVSLSRDSKLRQGALLLAVIWLALAAVPEIPTPIIPGLDPGWVLGLNMAHTQGLVHGKDIVWTYGPLGYLAYPDPSGHSMYPALTFRLGVYLLWCLALLRLSLVVRSQMRAAWIVVLIGFSVVLDRLMDRDHLALALFTWSLVVVVDRSKWRTAALAILAFVAALACMIKVNAGIEAACLFGSVAAAAALQEGSSRRMRWQIFSAILLFPLSIVLLYAVETRSVGSLPAYIRNSIEMASAYSEEMSYNGPIGQVWLAIIGIAVLFLVLPLAERPIRNLAAGFLPALVYTFFSFKTCMVRQDMHAADLQLRLAMAALFLLVLAGRKQFVYLTMCFQVACILISHHFISLAWPHTNAVIKSRLSLSGNWPSLKGYGNWSTTWADWERHGHENLSPLRVSKELQSIIGKRPIEVLPWEVARVYANGWHWSPRPIFQTYAAYTPRLDHINSEHLKNGLGADLALVSWDAIDGRHPFLDTPFSWQTQLDLYQTLTTDSDLLLLSRRPTSRFQAVEQIGGETTTWDREIRVPQSADPVAVSAQIERSITGRLRSFLFRSDPFFIEVERKSGRTERYRALRANFAEGVIINELPESLSALALLSSPGCALSDPVVAFRFQTDSPGEFRSPISLQWTRLVSRAEAAGDCVEFTRTTAKAPVWGGIGSVDVSAGSAANWSVTAKESWVTVPADGPRTGNGNLDYSVLKNPGSEPRQGAITIGNHAFKIFQLGSGTMLAEPTSIQFGFYGSTGPSPKDLSQPHAGNWDLVISQFNVFSAPEGQPVIGDWTGNGIMRIGMFRDGIWYLDLNGNRRWDGEEGGDGVFSFGLPGDAAAPGDWAGDGKTRLGVFRHGEWAFDINGNMKFDRSDRFARFGLEGDTPVVAKWSHDRMDRVGVYRDGTWLVDSNGDGVFDLTDKRFAFGLPGDLPIISSGSGKPGIYRKGKCILAPKAAGDFDADAVLMIPCGASRPLIAAW